MPALAREAADRMSALLLPGKGGQTATTTATRDDSGRSPQGERPGRRGGAEGTRTPDPHTASQERGVRLRPYTLATCPDAAGVVRERPDRTGPVDATVDVTALMPAPPTVPAPWRRRPRRT